jgi:hypothetical protein
MSAIHELGVVRRLSMLLLVLLDEFTSIFQEIAAIPLVVLKAKAS